ncbi:hypothetical protein E8E11_007652 [Didymella keratinophila]|nr:hypothetical protein E8E11_007652 [Didymella keratinophila]
MLQNASTINRTPASGSHEVARANINYEMFKLSWKHSIGAVRACSPLPSKLRGGGIINLSVPAHKDLVVQHINRTEPHDRTLTILSSLHPLVDAKRPNDFLNTLDLITANLLERSPNDAIAQGMFRAVTRLNGLYGLHFVMDDAFWTPRDQVDRRGHSPATLGVETDHEFNFNEIPAPQSFLDNSLLEVQPVLPIPMDLDLRSFPTSIPDQDQDQDRPFLEAIIQLLGENLHRQFDLSDQFTAQLVGRPQSHLGQQYVSQLADRIHARVDASISETINSRHAQNPRDRMLGHDMQDSMASVSGSLWLGPPPPAQDPFTISETANINPRQAYVDPILFWGTPEFLAPDVLPPATNDRAFVPDLGLLFSREGLVPEILA